MLSTFKLKNGLQVVTYNLPKLKSVHLRIVSKGGSIVENKKNNGVAHLMEHMLVQGTPSFTNVEEFSSYIESLAGTYGAYTQLLGVTFFVTVPTTYLEDAIRIVFEVFFKPLFLEEAIEKERGVIVNELKQKMDSHWFKISQFFRSTRFKQGHPLALDESGNVEIIKTLSRQETIDYWQKYFLPKNAFLAVTGNFSNSVLPKLLNKYFTKVSSSKTFPGFPQISNDDFSQRQVLIRADSSLQTIYLDLTYPSISLTDPLSLGLKQQLLLTVLGRLRNSRLFKLLRYQKGLVYDVSCSSSAVPNMGYVNVSSEVPPPHLDEVLGLITGELVNFFRHGPTQTELDFGKNFLTNQWMMAFDHPSSIASWIEHGMLWDDQVRLPEEYVKMIAGVTTQDLLTLMHRYWDFSKLNLTIQGPVENSKSNVKKFEEMVQELN